MSGPSPPISHWGQAWQNFYGFVAIIWTNYHKITSSPYSGPADWIIYTQSKANTIIKRARVHVHLHTFDVMGMKVTSFNPWYNHTFSPKALKKQAPIKLSNQLSLSLTAHFPRHPCTPVWWHKGSKSQSMHWSKVWNNNSLVKHGSWTIQLLNLRIRTRPVNCNWPLGSTLINFLTTINLPKKSCNHN